MKARTNRPFIAVLLRWVVTLIALVLVARLALTLFNLLFNFGATPIGHLLSEGELFARLADTSPLGIVRQLGIIVVIAAVIAIAQRARRNDAEQPTADHRERS